MPKAPKPTASRWQRKPQLVRFGKREIETRGLAQGFWTDLYHRALTVYWPVFFGTAAAIFVVLNAIFAFFFWLGKEPIANVAKDLPLSLFYFSIETLATVGYGDMHPGNLYAHVVVTLEIFTGLSTLAVFTGLIFARFSRPRAQIIFAERIVLGRHSGQTHLMARLANARHSAVSEAKAEIWFIHLEDTPEGRRFIRFKQLKLRQPRNPIFAFSWILFHPVDETSPLFGLGPEALEAMDARILVVFDGLDDVSGQRLNVRRAYNYPDLRFGHVYSDILTPGQEGAPPQLDYGKIHDTEPEDE